MYIHTTSIYNIETRARIHWWNQANIYNAMRYSTNIRRWNDENFLGLFFLFLLSLPLLSSTSIQIRNRATNIIIRARFTRTATETRQNTQKKKFQNERRDKRRNNKNRILKLVAYPMYRSKRRAEKKKTLTEGMW